MNGKYKDTKYKILEDLPGLFKKGTQTCLSIILKFFTQDGIDVMIANRFLEEVEDPKWTDSELKEMCIAYAREAHTHMFHPAGIETGFDKWFTDMTNPATDTREIRL